MARNKARIPYRWQQFDPIKQIKPMKAAFPQFRHVVGRNKEVTWKGTLQPTPDSPVYTVRIVYMRKRAPQVWVLHPRLHENAPHRYKDKSLCLYWPKEWRWSARESIADTIVGWTAIWLYYYEVWLVTDEWHGPSSHMEPRVSGEEPEEK